MHTVHDQSGSGGRWPRYIVVMGVCGVGKTTTARALAVRLGGSFVEADDLHAPESVALMASGRPLDDDARQPWLARVGADAQARSAAGEGPVVIACSSLKQRYRDVFRQALADVVFLHLHGPEEEIRRRMAGRTGHFMPPALLDSQLADLEVPGTEPDLVTLSILKPPEAIVEDAIAAIGALMPWKGPDAGNTDNTRPTTEETP